MCTELHESKFLGRILIVKPAKHNGKSGTIFDDTQSEMGDYYAPDRSNPPSEVPLGRKCATLFDEVRGRNSITPQHRDGSGDCVPGNPLSRRYESCPGDDFGQQFNSGDRAMPPGDEQRQDDLCDGLSRNGVQIFDLPADISEGQLQISLQCLNLDCVHVSINRLVQRRVEAYAWFSKFSDALECLTKTICVRNCPVKCVCSLSCKLAETLSVNVNEQGCRAISMSASPANPPTSLPHTTGQRSADVLQYHASSTRPTPDVPGDTTGDEGVEPARQQALETANLADSDGGVNEKLKGRQTPYPDREPTNSLHVWRLSEDTTDVDLYDIGAKYGRVVDTKVYDRNTGQPRCSGFINMSTIAEATRVLENINGFSLKGRRILACYSSTTQKQGFPPCPPQAGPQNEESSRREFPPRRDFNHDGPPRGDFRPGFHDPGHHRRVSSNFQYTDVRFPASRGPGNFPRPPSPGYGPDDHSYGIPRGASGSRSMAPHQAPMRRPPNPQANAPSEVLAGIVHPARGRNVQTLEFQEDYPHPVWENPPSSTRSNRDENVPVSCHENRPSSTEEIAQMANIEAPKPAQTGRTPAEGRSHNIDASPSKPIAAPQAMIQQPLVPPPSVAPPTVSIPDSMDETVISWMTADCCPSCEPVTAKDLPSDVKFMLLFVDPDDNHFFWAALVYGNKEVEMANALILMSEIPEQLPAARPLSKRVGVLLDGEWTRAWVQGMVGREAVVRYIDYGNMDQLQRDSLRQLPDDCWKHAPMAVPCYARSFANPTIDAFTADMCNSSYQANVCTNQTLGGIVIEMENIRLP